MHLQSEPFNAPWVKLGQEFEPEPVEDSAKDPYAAQSIGGALIVIVGSDSDAMDTTLGAYFVYESAGDADAFAAEFEGEEGWYRTPLEIAGFDGSIFYSGEGRAQSVMPIGNVLILSTDVLLETAAYVDPEPAVIRTTHYFITMLDHLRSMTRPRD